MKRSTKRDIAITCSVLALGCFLMAAGWGMGGSLTTGRNISIGGSNGVRVGSDGLFVGGSNGIYVGPYGISIGGRNGIYVGPAGIRIGSSGSAYAEVEATTDLIDQVWASSGVEQEQVTAWTDGDTTVQNIEVKAFDCIQANIDLGGISVIQDGPGYFITFQNNVDDYELQYSFDGSTLVIGSEGGKGGHWGTVNAKASVTIIVPASAGLKDVDLHSDLGDIYVGTFDRGIPTATVETNLGDVTWYSSEVKELNAHSSLGNVTVMLPSLEKVGYELSTSLGEIIVGNEVMTKDKTSYQPRDKESYVWADSDLGDVYLGAGS